MAISWTFHWTLGLKILVPWISPWILFRFENSYRKEYGILIFNFITIRFSNTLIKLILFERNDNNAKLGENWIAWNWKRRRWRWQFRGRFIGRWVALQVPLSGNSFDSRLLEQPWLRYV